MSSRGKIRVTKSVHPSDKLVDNRGMVLKEVKFADSFIFSEVGNESMIEYDVTDQNWYLDISKMIPSTPTSDMFNILDLKEGDTITYDPSTEKFINSQLLSNDVTKIKSDLQSLDYILKISNSRIQTLMDSNDTISNNVNRVNEKLDIVKNDIESIPELKTKVSSIDVEIKDIKRTLDNLPDDDNTEIENQIQTLTTQISQLTELLSTQQKFISTVTSSGLPTFKYTEIDKEVPYGVLDGINSRFELQLNPILGSEYVYLNGILQMMDSNYTIKENSINFIETPSEGMSIICSYRISTGDVITPNAKFYGVGYKNNSSLLYTIVDREAPIGLVNGKNYVFELLNQPIESSESVFLNGVLQESGGEHANYNIIGNIITFVEPPLLGMSIICTYKIL
jgi:archaellum component FlaC